jgi:hypothetical protein
MQSLSTQRIPAPPSSQREQSSLEQKSKLKSVVYEDSKLDCCHCDEGGAGMHFVERDCMKISLARTSNWHEERGKETNFKVHFADPGSINNLKEGTLGEGSKLNWAHDEMTISG